MDSILLTLTLKSESGQDLILIKHLKKFRASKGIQERSFEIRRLLHAGLSNHRAFSESFEVRNQSPYQNTSVKTATTPGVDSFSPGDDFSHNSSKEFTKKAASSVPEINLSKPIERVNESVKVIDVAEVDIKRNIEPRTQQSLPVLSLSLSLSSESVNSGNSDPNNFEEMLISVDIWEFGKAKQAENTNVTTGEIT